VARARAEAPLFKHLLRKAAARSVEAICTAIGELLGCSHPRNAPTTSETQATHRPKITAL